MTAAPSRRHAGSLRDIERRLKSIKNIEKITKTMKVVASTRLTLAQRAMTHARQYGLTNDELFKQAEAGTKDEGGDAAAQKVLYITASSDKGLCGGIHSQLSKFTRAQVAEEEADASVVVIGDKSKAQLSRMLPDKILLTFNQIGKDVPTFAEAQTVADQIYGLEGMDFDRIVIIHNKFKSMISYEPSKITVFSEEALKASPKFAAYEIEDDVLTNLKEFALANAIYWALVEGHACEISARQTAMDNASKNAGDMIDRFNLLYNRTRQAVITNGMRSVLVICHTNDTDLVDIIVGASAQE